jgi:hypothetical protein
MMRESKNGLVRVLNARVAILLGCCIAAAAALSVHFQTWGGNLSRVILALSVLPVVLLGSRGLGRPILRGILGEKVDPIGEGFISIVLGFFALEMMIFLGGALQVLRSPLGWLIFGSILVPAALYECLRKRPSDGSLRNVGVVEIFAALVFAVGSATYLLGSFLPPQLYDALEYHLGVPWQWIEEGGFYRIDGNVFSNFPFNTEMFYTFSLLLFPGGELATLLHWAMGVLIAVGIVALGSHFGNRGAGWLAAFLYYFTLPVRNLSVGANIDLGVGLAALATVWALLLWIERPTRRRLALPGTIAGIALGSKYTCLLILLVPVFLVVIFETFRKSENRGRAVLMNTCLFWGFSLVAFSPWLAKNLLYQGNPIFPLGYGVFGGSSWTPGEAEIFNGAVAPNFVDGLRTAGWNPENLRRFFTGGTLVLSLLWVPLLRRGGQKTSGLKEIHWIALAAYVLWLLLTPRVDRFIVPVFPFVLIPFVLMNPLARWTARGAVPLVLALAFAAFQIPLLAWTVRDFAQSGGWDYLAGRKTAIEMNRPLGYAPLIEIINGLPSEGRPKVLFVGEARAFGVRYPVEVSTVFNHSSLLVRYEEEGSPEGVLDRLRREGFTHILVNEVEINRLHSFYSGDGWNERDGILKIVGEITRTSGVRVVGRNHTQKGDILLFALH